MAIHAANISKKQQQQKIQPSLIFSNDRIKKCRLAVDRDCKRFYHLTYAIDVHCGQGSQVDLENSVWYLVLRAFCHLI